MLSKQTRMNPINNATLPLPVREMVQATPRGQVSRNSPCPCGSGQRFKRCHGKKHNPHLGYKRGVTHPVVQ